LKLTLAIDAATYQNDTGGTLRIPLHCTEINSSLTKQRGKTIAYGVNTQPTKKSSV
jgi:hypothetical protein